MFSRSIGGGTLHISETERLTGSRPWTGMKDTKRQGARDDIYSKEPDMDAIQTCLTCKQPSCSGFCQKVAGAAKPRKYVPREPGKERKRSGPPRRRDIVPDGFAELYGSGAPYSELRARFKTSNLIIAKWRDKLGLPKRNNT